MAAPAALRLVFGGDVMLGRLVREAMLRDGVDTPLGAVSALLRAADLAVANLECAITGHAERWPGAPKAFYFGAAPMAAQALRDAGIGLLGLANNHILDYGVPGLLDTLSVLDAHGIAHAGAGRDLEAALLPAIALRRGLRVGMAAFCDHQADFAAGLDRPGMAWLDLHDEGVAIGAFARARALLRAAGADWTCPCTGGRTWCGGRRRTMSGWGMRRSNWAFTSCSGTARMCFMASSCTGVARSCTRPGI